ncbi:MAG: hypothetical protein A2046_02190 [Bacteroidetes bacterium GWA2_30_7]|nr:MAG: hypothetical protein A2046_02190 [Bacteroidetes bacterium GWA2_30_7]
MENCKLADAKRNTSTLLSTSKKDEAKLVLNLFQYSSPNLLSTNFEEQFFFICIFLVFNCKFIY